MKTYLKAKRIYTPQGIQENTGILVSHGRIEQIGSENEENVPEIDLTSYSLLPGLIDMHIHGSNGFDTMDASYDALNGISAYLARNGVTSFVPTTVTARMDKIEAALQNIAHCVEKGLDGAKALGAYVEGPYINKEHKGAHPENLIRDINSNEIKDLIEKSHETIRVMTIAPEKENSPEAIRFLTQRGIKVSMGHTNATYDEALEAVNNGADIAVHLYNGMRGLHQREAGMLGAALNDDRIYTELICDLIHVSVPAIQIILRCKKKENIVLITDCMMAGGLKDGEYQLGELKVWVKDNVARVDTGSLAGSTLRLIDAVRNMNQRVGVPLADAVEMASLNPARVLKVDGEYGSLQVGKKADIIAVDEDLKVVFTMIDGKIVFQ